MALTNKHKLSAGTWQAQFKKWNLNTTCVGDQGLLRMLCLKYKTYRDHPTDEQIVRVWMALVEAGGSVNPEAYLRVNVQGFPIS